jgi:hypothetical protein
VRRKSARSQDQQTVGEAIIAEREYLLALPEEAFDLAEVSYPKLDGLSRARVRTNFYSAPLRPGTEVEARVHASYIEIRHEGECVARHERCYGRQQEILDLEHYLDVLEHKPGALAGSKPLVQWRRQGRWPASFDEIWQQLMNRNGRQAGTRAMIELVSLGKSHGYERLRHTVEAALKMGSCDVATVRYLLTADDLNRPPTEAIDIGLLCRYERPMPVMSVYDQLLARPEVLPLVNQEHLFWKPAYDLADTQFPNGRLGATRRPPEIWAQGKSPRRRSYSQ